MTLQNAIHERVDTWNKAGLQVGAKLSGYYVRDEKFTSAAYGDGKKFIIADESGKEIAGVMAQAVIERAFMNIPRGAYVEITFKGKETTAKGQQVNAYDIQFDPEKTL